MTLGNSSYDQGDIRVSRQLRERERGIDFDSGSQEMHNKALRPRSSNQEGFLEEVMRLESRAWISGDIFKETGGETGAGEGGMIRP